MRARYVNGNRNKNRFDLAEEKYREVCIDNLLNLKRELNDRKWIPTRNVFVRYWSRTKCTS